MALAKILDEIKGGYDQKQYQNLHWEGSLDDYINIFLKEPAIARSAFQRLHDMILSYGSEEYIDHRKKVTKYQFFSDPVESGKDAIFGLDVPLMKLVNLFNAASRRYGPEKRVLLLHGPVGSSKSTIVRLLKKGIAAYSRTSDGKVFTFSWKPLDLPHRQELFGSVDEFPCPMHEEPLRLFPQALRTQAGKKFSFKMSGLWPPPCRWAHDATTLS